MNVSNEPLTWALDFSQSSGPSAFHFSQENSKDQLDLPQPHDPWSLGPGENYLLGVVCSPGK